MIRATTCQFICLWTQVLFRRNYLGFSSETLADRQTAKAKARWEARGLALGSLSPASSPTLTATMEELRAQEG